MGDPTDPLEIGYASGPSDLRLARQPPPAGTASWAATFVAPAGWAYDPPRAGGTARLASLLVPSGAGARDRRALARTLDRAGASLSAHVDPESAEVTIWGPAARWEALLGLLGDIVLRPRFGAGDLARVRRQLFERQLRDETQPGYRVEREMLAALFAPGHPYGSTGVGDRRSVARVDPEAIRRYRRTHFSGSGSVLVVTGPVPLARLRSVVGRLFADLPATGPAPPTLPPPMPPRRRPVEVDLPGTAQVDVRLARVSLPRADPAYPAAYLANEVLGGSTLLSRLYARVRGKGGLAYHASSQLEAMRWGGYWDARVGTGPERWRRVVPMLREETARIVHDLVPARELATVCESRIGALRLDLESTAEAHELAVDTAYYGRAPDYWRRWPELLRALTPREVRRAAEVAFDPDVGVSIAVGPLGHR